MNTEKTLKQIFEEHGINPWMAFFAHQSDWPQEARDLMANPVKKVEPEFVDNRDIFEGYYGNDRGE